MKTLAEIMAITRTEELEAIKAYYTERHPEPMTFVNYLDYKPLLEKAYDQAVNTFTLNTAEPKSILDLGCGCGYFPYIAKQFGHAVTLLDQNSDGEDLKAYGEMLKVLELTRTEATILPGIPLPEELGKFDLITVLDGWFPKEWEERDWQFFLQDIRTKHLLPGGKLYLNLYPRTRGFMTLCEMKEVDGLIWEWKGSDILLMANEG